MAVANDSLVWSNAEPPQYLLSESRWMLTSTFATPEPPVSEADPAVASVQPTSSYTSPWTGKLIVKLGAVVSITTVDESLPSLPATSLTRARSGYVPSANAGLTSNVEEPPTVDDVL